MGSKLTEMLVFGMGMGRRPTVLGGMVTGLEGRNTALRGLGMAGFSHSSSIIKYTAHDCGAASISSARERGSLALDSLLAGILWLCGSIVDHFYEKEHQEVKG